MIDSIVIRDGSIDVKDDLSMNVTSVKYVKLYREGAGRLRTHVHINDSEINIQKMEMNQTKLNRGQT